MTRAGAIRDRRNIADALARAARSKKIRSLRCQLAAVNHSYDAIAERARRHGTAT